MADEESSQSDCEKYDPKSKKMKIIPQFTKEQLDRYEAQRKKYVGLFDIEYRSHLVPRRTVQHLMKSPKLRTLTYEEIMPRILRVWFKFQQHEARKKFFQVLKEVEIPNDIHLIEIMLLEDDRKYSFNDMIWFYNSPVLCSYAPVNMTHRYRGVPITYGAINCLDLDIKKLTTKDVYAKKADEKKEKAKRLTYNPYTDVGRASISKLHYAFLKDVTAQQLITIPLTILHTAMRDVYPHFVDTHHEYCFFLSEANGKSQDIERRRGLIRDKINIYNSL